MLASQETRAELSFKAFTMGILFHPFFYDIFISGTHTQVYRLVKKYISEWYIKHVNSTCGYVLQALTGLYSLLVYCGPIVSNHFLIKFGKFFPHNVQVVGETFEEYLRKMNFQQKSKWWLRWRPFLTTSQVLGVACPRINGSNVFAKL